ncbi:MAG: deacylase [Bacteriovorax sp. MedPE-SWde]|nr:MAG: deacylase [Bacteriovorax sp. MedPE-SWde]
MNSKLQNFLIEERINYISLPHSVAIPAQKVAQVAHISGNSMAKTVIVSADGVITMSILPASTRLDLDDLKKTMGAKKVRLAKEYEFRDLFPDCEVGAMPPFGNLYEMNVFVSKKLASEEHIYFNAGNHSEIVRLSYTDFDNAVHPVLADI